MADYTWLYFDLDNTILDFSKASKLAFFDIFKEMDLPMTDLDYDIYSDINHTVWVEFEKGQIGALELRTRRWKLFADDRSLDIDPRKVNAAYFAHISQNPIYVPGAESILAKLKDKYKLAIITNGLAEVQIPRLHITGLDKIFDPIVISEEIGVAKPAAAFFDYVQKLTGHPATEEVLVIGDSLNSDIRGGINYGFDTCWYNYYKAENKSEYHATYEITELSALLELL